MPLPRRADLHGSPVQAAVAASAGAGVRYRPMTSRVAAALAASLAAAALLAGCQSSGSDNPAIGGGGIGQTAEVTMNPVSGGPSGTASLEESPSLVFTVNVDLTPAVAAQEPAGVHTGTCNTFDPTVKFNLSPVSSGKSGTTLLNTTLSELQSTPYVIVVQRSATDGAAISCGQIPPATASP